MISRRSLVAGGLATALLAGCSKELGASSTLGGINAAPVPTDVPPRLRLREVGTMSVADGKVVVADHTVIDVRDGVATYDLDGLKQLWPVAEDDLEKIDLPEGVTLSGIAAATIGDKPLVLGTTYVNPCPGGASLCHSSQTDLTEGKEVVAFDARTGRLLWRSPVIKPVARSSPDARMWDNARIKVVGGTADAIVVGLLLNKNAQIRTVALDPSSGRQLWSLDGYIPALIGTSAVILTPKWLETVPFAGLSSMRLHDLRSGKQLSLSGVPDRDAIIKLPAGAPYVDDDLVLATGTSGGDVWAVDLRRHKVVAGPRGALVVGRRSGADDAVLFAGGGDSRGMFTQAEGEQLRYQLPDPENSAWTPTPIAVTQGVIWRAGSRSSSDGLLTPAVDRTGKTVLTPVARRADRITSTFLLTQGTFYRLEKQ